METITYQGMALEQAARQIRRNQRWLSQLGYDDNAVGAITRAWGHRIWIGDTQVCGFYVHADGVRYPHFATRGWYTIENVDDGLAACTLLRSCCDAAPFECRGDSLRTVLLPNVDYPDQWEADLVHIRY